MAVSPATRTKRYVDTVTERLLAIGELMSISAK